MKIAEALTRRGALDNDIKALRARIQMAARYVEGEEPAEDAADLLARARELLEEHGNLVAAINKSNTLIRLDDGMSLTDALALRSRLLKEIGLLNWVADEASPAKGMYQARRRTELAEKTDLPVAALRGEADRLASQVRDLDGRIQRVNWAEDLQ